MPLTVDQLPGILLTVDFAISFLMGTRSPPIGPILLLIFISGSFGTDWSVFYDQQEHKFTALPGIHPGAAGEAQYCNIGHHDPN